jgi:hypothetical protein
MGGSGNFEISSRLVPLNNRLLEAKANHVLDHCIDMLRQKVSLFVDEVFQH